jgi:hypothetical protein
MSKSYELVPFSHGAIPTITNGDDITVIIKPVCEIIGLDWESQRQRINRHPVLAEGACIMEVPSGGGIQSTMVMTLEAFHAFLLTLHPDRIKDEVVRERIIAYQRTAFRVVFEHFHGPLRIASPKRPTVAEFLRVGAALKKERNPALRAALWADLDRITDAWGQAPVARAIGYADPDHTERLEEFWTAIKGLEEAGMAINQSRGNALIALHLPQIRRIFAEVGMEIDIDRALTEALRHSKSPRFIGFKAVNCKDEMFRKCWVFSAVPSDEAAKT